MAETWRVNSYGYPNPFGGPKAVNAWVIAMSFSDHGSYRALKQHWESQPRPLPSHAVESWKAAFEQFGILYVLTGDDEIHITPGGKQLRQAAANDDSHEFAWVGINLLLRYPLRGKAGRRSRGKRYEESDLLPYWLVLAMVQELGGQLWHSEFFRILANAFTRSDAERALETIRKLREGQIQIEQYPDPSNGRTGAIYNALNQVMVQVGLNHMIVTSSREDSPYMEAGEKENRWYIKDEYHDLVNLALGPAPSIAANCTPKLHSLGRMPAAPDYLDDEQAYWDYVGAAVPSFNAASAVPAEAVPTIEQGGETVYLLTQGQHFDRIDPKHIQGPVQALCMLVVDDRVIVSYDLESTYKVEDKQLVPGGRVQVRLRQARPVIDKAYVLSLFSGRSRV
jgi:hypothetical protein